MPLYQYTCADCEETFEVRHRYSDTGIVCKLCQSENIKKFLGNKSLVTSRKAQNKQSIGSEVIKAIEEGRADLETTKKKLDKERERDD